jgi:hypothetical protein
MDTGQSLRAAVENVLGEYARIPYAYGDLQCEAVFDRGNDRYLLVTVGWNGDRRVHGSLVHIDIVGDKLWIQRDGTEHGIANDLVTAGVPKEQIVLAFRPPKVRPFTGFAVA